MPIRVNASKTAKKITNFWNHVHFHPTDAIEDEWGQFVLSNIAKDGVAQRVRIYAMLEDIVFSDSEGGIRYDFSLLDARLDFMVKMGFSLLICFNYMPPAIASNPLGMSFDLRYKSKRINTSSPKSYLLWEEVCRAFTAHIVERYGESTVSDWYFHCWNEPDLRKYFLSEKAEDYPLDKVVEEYEKLYDHFAKGVSDICPAIRLGGPSACCSYEFIKMFLTHVKSGTNHATGKVGVKFDFFTTHSYADGLAGLAASNNMTPYTTLERVKRYREILAGCGFEDLEMIVDEWEYCTNGFQGTKEAPIADYRNSELFPSYFANLIDVYIRNDAPVSEMMICLSGQHNLKRDFEGYRNFFTLNRFPKPIYNGFRLLSLLGKGWLENSCDEDYCGVIPTVREDGSVAVLVYYMSNILTKELPDKIAEINIDGLNGSYSLHHYRIDHTVCNSYTKWCELGRPENPDMDERRKISQAGQFREWFEPKQVEVCGAFSESIVLTQNSLTLIELKKL